MQQRLKRIWIYLSEMAPPYVILPVGLLKFAAVYLCLQGIAGVDTLYFGWRAWLGGLTLGGVMLLMRVYDELKDVDNDIRLGRAGDPRYKDRAIVRGAVTVDDVRLLRNVLTASLVALNLAMLSAAPLVGFAVLFAVLWLSSVWFFWPAIADNLALAFVTHNPISLVTGVYIVSVFAGDFGLQSLPLAETLLLLVAMWLPFAAWETSRKVRVPADETDYQTYSKLLGWKTAAVVPAVFVLAASAAMAWVAYRAELSGWFFVALGAAALLPVGGCLRFRLAPTSKRSHLQPLTEAYAGVFDVALVGALVAAYGVTLG